MLFCSTVGSNPTLSATFFFQFFKVLNLGAINIVHRDEKLSREPVIGYQRFLNDLESAFCTSL